MHDKDKEKKRDRDIVLEAAGDPAFYNDQIDDRKQPVKKAMEERKDGK